MLKIRGGKRYSVMNKGWKKVQCGRLGSGKGTV